MGSIQENKNCKHCNSINCNEEYYYKSNEIYVNCPDCGYHYTAVWKRNSDGHFEKDDKGELIPVETELANPFGALVIKMKSGIAQIMSLTNEEEYNSMKSDIDRCLADKDVEDLTLRQFDLGLTKVTSLKFNTIETFEVITEFEQIQENHD